jgi:hypothetical protein
MVGAMLQDSSPASWSDTLDALPKVDVSAIQEMLPEGQESFFRAIDVSFRALAPQMHERYRALAVLLEDMAAPRSILQTLWNVNEPEARRTSRLLVDRSLAQRDEAYESIRLHDLQLDYVRAQYQDRKPLELIHGAVRLSSNVTARDARQFTSEMVGRLLPDRHIPAIEEFTKRVRWDWKIKDSAITVSVQAIFLAPFTFRLAIQAGDLIAPMLNLDEAVSARVVQSGRNRAALHQSQLPGRQRRGFPVANRTLRRRPLR